MRMAINLKNHYLSLKENKKKNSPHPRIRNQNQAQKLPLKNSLTPKNLHKMPQKYHPFLKALSSLRKKIIELETASTIKAHLSIFVRHVNS
jgi:hypothetical protein